MFETVETAPPDAILGLTEAFQSDPNPAKINLGAGVYKDETGVTPVLAAVKEAERRLLERETTKNYLPIEGTPEYGRLVEELLFGAGHEILAERRAVTAHTPGGTGALRLAGDFLQDHRPGTGVWVSDPTWVNHHQIFTAAGLAVTPYPYYDPATRGLAFDRLLETFRSLPAGAVVILHGVCHNPSGVDPTPEQWEVIARTLAERRALPLVDVAYLGFAEGLREDTAPIHTLARHHPELLVATSFSKTMGLYRERVGALTVVTATRGAAAAVLSQLKRTIRASYSNPPSHGGAVVAEVLGDAELRDRWCTELGAMRRRITVMRQRLAAQLDARGLHLGADGNGFITRQKGMFSFTGLTREQVAELRERHSFYIVGSGRINVAALTEANVGRLADALAEVGARYASL